jgi:uncharacterized SAM-binding protein YcdF (DUF218 family)
VSLLADGLRGALLLLLGLGCLIWFKPAWAGILLTGILLMAGGWLGVQTARKWARNAAPCLKLGKAGIWTARTGFQTWQQVQVVVGSLGEESPVLLRLLAANSASIELFRVEVDDLDMDERNLRALLKGLHGHSSSRLAWLSKNT